MRILSSLVVGLAFLASQPAVAAPPVPNKLGECLKDSTSGKDRKDLARWIYMAMSAHPDMASLTTATPAQRVEVNKEMAQLVTRLLLENCSAQTRAVLQSDGSQGMLSAFQSLGEVAMMELMSNPDVSATITGYTKFLDQQKFEAILRNNPPATSGKK